MTETLMNFLMPIVWIVLVLSLAGAFLKSIYSIGPTEVGLVRKRFGKKLPGDNPVAFKGEAGYQAELLMPGLRLMRCCRPRSATSSGISWAACRL